MSGPGPSSARLLVSFSLTAATGAWLGSATSLVGAAPLLLIHACAGVGLALALAGLVGGLGSGPRRRWAGLASLGLLPLMVALTPLLLANPLRVGIDARAWPPLILAWTTLASLPMASRARRVWQRSAPAVGPDLLGFGLGLAVASLAPPPLGASLAALALAPLWGPPTTSPRLPPGDDHGLLRVPGVAMASAALVFGWSHIRPAVDPSAASATTVLLVAGAAALLARPLGPIRPGLATLAGASSLLIQWLLLWKGPGLARRALLDPTAIHPLLPPELSAQASLILAAALGGLALGLSFGRRRASPLSWLGLPLGALLVGVGEDAVWIWVAGGVAITAPLWSLRREVQVGGVAVAALAAGLGWMGARPDPSLWSAGAWPLLRTPVAAAEDAGLRAQLQTEVVQVGVRGSWSVLRAAAPADERPLRSEAVAASLRIEVDGLVVEGRGRLAEAEALGGHLAGALAAEQRSVLVLGDEAGRATSSTTEHPFERIVVATPPRAIVQAMAELAPALKATWLDPRVLLRPHPPALVLAEGRRFDAIVQIIRTPWASASQPAPTAALFASAGAALEEDGVYILVLHSLWMEAGGPAAIAATFSEAFPAVQAWLPPQGADSLILVGSQQPLPLQRALTRLPRSGSWDSVPGIRSAEDLASLAISDAPGLRAWQDTLGAHMPAADRLSPSIRQRPILHLASLANHLAAAEAIWAIEPQAELTPLRARLEAREGFLRLLGEATGGDMEAVFTRARALRDAGEGLGGASLEDLIEPHLRDGRRSLERASREGIASKSWDEALRYAMTAQMLAPTSAGPLVLLAEIDLGRGRVAQAEEGFAKALELKPDELSALTGAARTARLRGDLSAARGHLEAATRVAPRDWRTWQNLGVLLMQSGEREAAEEALQRAILYSEALEPGPHLALAENQLDAGKAAAALLTADRANATQETAYGWYLRGRAHRDLGQSQRAEEDFRRAILLDPELAEARAGIGLVLAERGELEQAAEAWRTVVRLRPDNGVARETLRRIEEDIAAAEARLRP